MRPKISRSNLNYVLAQQYGYANMNQFFKLTEDHPKHKEAVVKHIIKEFTGYYFKDAKLQCYNPYTGKHEALKIKSFKHVQTREDLLKELMMLHKTQQQMLIQSRKRILKLSKQKTLERDVDLKTTIDKSSSKRLQQLDKDKDIGDKEPEQEL